MGEDMAKVIFQKIRWAPPEKVRQDIGTDLITFARDVAAPDTKAKAWDLGAPVLMQVKGSEKEYLKPKHRRTGEPGWWFAESTTYHFDHWLSFGLPYLLVLVDETNQIAYWAQVTGKAIVSTGKGRKIFVPVSQKVDAESVEALNTLAVGRRKYDLEGTVWGGKLNDLGPADRLRHALVMPRLVAPHPNTESTNLTSEEAAAMVMRNRTNEFAHRATSGKCPQPEDWATHKEWGWRFVDALRELVTIGTSEKFPQLAKDARHRFERDTCLVVQACIAYTSNDIDAAVTLLKPSQATKPADRGWMRAQLAALLMELDKPKEAAKAAKEALFAMKALEGDLTVSAIRGGAASVLYSTAGVFIGDLAGTITAQDNAGSWWRAQDVSWALEKDLTVRFEAWAGSNTMHFVSSTARSELTTAEWNAALGGAWGSWRHLTRLNAQLTFTTTTDPVLLGSALSWLVFIGEKKAAKEAAQKMWEDGPVGTLTAVVNALAHRQWSKRDEGAALAVLGAAGDLLTAKAADCVVARIIDILKIDGDIRTHGHAWSWRWTEVDRTLRVILHAATIKSHRACADLVAENFADCTDSIADSLIRIANGVATAHLGTRRINKLVKVATARPDHDGLDLLEALGRDSVEVIAELRRRADDGNDRAFRALLVAGSDEHDDYMAFGRSAARTVKQMVIDATGTDGTIAVSAYVNDQLHDLTLAAMNTNDKGLWKSVTDALEAGVIEVTQLQRSVRVLARQFPSLPPHVQRKLRKLAPNLRGTNLGFSIGRNEFVAAAIHLRIAAGTVPDLEVEALLLSQRRDDPLGFVNTLASWNGEHKLPFLSTMVVDDHPRVRGQAGFSLVEHAHRFPDDEARALAVLRSALRQDQGCCLADGAAQGIAAFPSENLEPLGAQLRRHPSALIRSRFGTDE